LVFALSGYGLIKSYESKTNKELLIENQKAIEDHKQFIAEKDKWLALGKKFDFADWKKF